MLDLKEEIKDFKPVDLSGLSSEEALYTESMRIAFTLYNKALKEIREGYRDLAKNNLRKAVTHYPEFGDAMIVLAICTFVNGDRIGAVRLFNAIKKPEDRKKGMEILDHLASAPDYIPPRDSTPPAVEVRTVQPVYEKPVFGKYSEPAAQTVVSSREIPTELFPAEIRPASQPSGIGEEGIQRTRGVRTQYTGTHRQELMRKAQQSDSQAQPAVSPSMDKTISEPQKERQEVRVAGDVFRKNKVLTLIFVLLAAFTILAAAAWMHATAQNRKLKADLSERPSVSATQSPSATPT